jgi:Flp pilus assembly protein TadG
MRLTFLHRFVPQRLRQFWSSERGTTAIEFAFVAPMMIVILLGTMQVAVLYIAESYLMALSEQAMRIVLTNNAYSLTAAQFQTQICAKLTALFSCNNLIVNLQPITTTDPTQLVNSMPTFTNTGALKNPTNFTVGTATDKMLLTLIYPWPVIGGPSWLGLSFADADNNSGTRRLVATQVFYKEPCLNANGCNSGS